ncbi:MAG: tRNA (N6-isopentenyl adenosine(37)-C2)-methylthiotransferase MiaB [Desulfohalobiaceae bacterium]|nr:tRNA (N6-isopentenyl adenosine(37)-C2)-methylthiotransferase MiaB [Desulfohalobiaceae bacterium]
MKFHIVTFGCQMNDADSAWLELALTRRGWEHVPEERARVFVVNTCSVREKPEHKVYSLLGRLERHCQDRDGFICVGGCVAQQVGREFWRRFPRVRLVFGPDGLASVPDSLEKLTAWPDLRISLLDFADSYLERDFSLGQEKAPPQAYVNIMQGCDNFCAYCIVPYTRGRQKSRSSSKILLECSELVRAGTREITLLGQNVNSYGLDANGDGLSFARLLEQICRIPELKRVRFTTSHPKDLAPEVIESFARFPNLCPALHLPLQSGSNRILKRMGRKYTKERYLDLIRQLRQTRPDMVLTTDLIVGFPGETDDDFSQTMDLVKEVAFDSSFSFKYSDRPGVRAASFSDKVPEEIKAFRLQLLQREQDRITAQSLRNLVGTDRKCLVEGRSLKSRTLGVTFWKGREPGGRIVNFSGPAGDLTGQLIPVTITQAKKHSVFGEVGKSYD